MKNDERYFPTTGVSLQARMSEVVEMAEAEMGE
jgi:hypothetical protein